NESTSSCFEIVTPQRFAHPRSPLLFNKCTGQTWLLVPRYAETATGKRTDRVVYRWATLEVEGTPHSEVSNPGRASAVTKPAKTGTPSSGGAKCFVFMGRQFCE